MAYEWARVGARCIYTGRTPHKNKTMARLKANSIYTIRGTVVHPVRKDIGLYLEEVINPVAEHFGLEYAYALSGFRPLISQSDDVEMFRRISEDMMGRLEVLEDVLNEQYLCDETHE